MISYQMNTLTQQYTEVESSYIIKLYCETSQFLNSIMKYHCLLCIYLLFGLNLMRNFFGDYEQYIFNRHNSEKSMVFKVDRDIAYI